MTEPTDHHDQAEAWLTRAAAPFADNNDFGSKDLDLFALIGIGHALLALSDPEPAYDGEDAPFARTMVRTVSPQWCPQELASGNRCGRIAGHPGDHRP